jgi:hypothetical protein
VLLILYWPYDPTAPVVEYTFGDTASTIKAAGGVAHL